jgi:pimeloyl-ACP methyl ester carboxylesterase
VSAAASPARFRRRFADLPWGGQIHYREAGEGGSAPLVMLHGAGASGAGLLPLAGALAAARRVIVPDMPGAGESDPLPQARVEIADLAAMLADFLDALGIARADLHGAHLGARIATEAALTAPGRVRRVVLDGVGFYDDAARAAMLAHVAPEFAPDLDGAYLLRAFQMCPDYYRFFPWFAKDAAHRRATGLPPAEAVHAKLMEVLRNGRTYPRIYHAAIRYPLEEALPRLAGRAPVLLATARTDNVLHNLARAASLLPGAPVAETPGAATPETAAQTAAIFAVFLDAPD